MEINESQCYYYCHPNPKYYITRVFTKERIAI